MTESTQTEQEINRGRTTATKRLESSAKGSVESGSSYESTPLHTTPTTTSATEDEENNEGSESNGVPAPLNEVSTASTQSTTTHPYPWAYATTTLEAAFEGKLIGESIATQSQPPPQTAASYTYHFKDTKHTELGPLYNVVDDPEEDDDHDEDVRTPNQGIPSTVQPDANPALESSANSAIAQRAATIIQAFLAHGEACTAAEAEALKLATTPTSFGSHSHDVVEDNDEEDAVNEYRKAETSSPRGERLKTQDPDGDTDSENEGIFKRRDETHEDELEDVDTRYGDQSENADEMPVQQHDDDEEEKLERKLQEFRDMLGGLEKLHAEAVDLQASLQELIGPHMHDRLDGPGVGPNIAPDSQSSSDASNPISATAVTTTAEETAISQFAVVVKACLPVLTARIANLEMALELLDSAQENLTITYKMESLGL